MNRRQLLAAGVGLTGLAMMENARPKSCSGADEQGQRDTYCPIYAYMYCGSYTMYYDVLYDGKCEMNPLSMAGPNNLPLGCTDGSGGPGCVSRDKKRTESYAIHTKLKDHGLKSLPNRNISAAPGTILVRPQGYLVNVTQEGKSFYARIYRVTISINDVDKQTLDDVDPKIYSHITDGTPFSFGHQVNAEVGEEVVDPNAIGVADGKFGSIVTANVDGAGPKPYSVIRGR